MIIKGVSIVFRWQKPVKNFLKHLRKSSEFYWICFKTLNNWVSLHTASVWDNVPSISSLAGEKAWRAVLLSCQDGEQKQRSSAPPGGNSCRQWRAQTRGGGTNIAGRLRDILRQWQPNWRALMLGLGLGRFVLRLSAGGDGNRGGGGELQRAQEETAHR